MTMPALDRPAPDPVLEVRGLGLHYGSRCALRGVDLRLERGTITALVGPSGCGKSSLLMALNRLSDLVPGCRVSGSILFEGRDLHEPGQDLTALRRAIGMIFQTPSPFPFSIHRNLALPLREHGVRDRVELETRIRGALEDVGLWDEVQDRLGAAAQKLSGGQQQRLCLARALALRPRILLLDEPCSALDPLASKVVEDRIVQLRPRLTQLVVTHNLAQARRIADHVAIVWQRDGAGTIVESGPVEEVFARPREAETRAYLSGEQG